MISCTRNSAPILSRVHHKSIVRKLFPTVEKVISPASENRSNLTGLSGTHGGVGVVLLAPGPAQDLDVPCASLESCDLPIEPVGGKKRRTLSEAQARSPLALGRLEASHLRVGLEVQESAAVFQSVQLKKFPLPESCHHPFQSHTLSTLPTHRASEKKKPKPAPGLKKKKENSPLRQIQQEIPARPLVEAGDVEPARLVGLAAAGAGAQAVSDVLEAAVRRRQLGLGAQAADDGHLGVRGARRAAEGAATAGERSAAECGGAEGVHCCEVLKL